MRAGRKGLGEHRRRARSRQNDGGQQRAPPRAAARSQASGGVPAVGLAARPRSAAATPAAKPVQGRGTMEPRRIGGALINRVE
jgi:hypothetical protein